MKFARALIAATILIPQSAQAEIIAQCGASKGRSYFVEGGIVAKGKGGWLDDRIDEGKIAFSVDDKGIDILFVDSTGSIRSHRALGSTVRIVAFNRSDDVTIIVAENKTSVEHYLLKLDPNGSGTLIWGTVTTDGLRTKSSIFQSECTH